MRQIRSATALTIALLLVPAALSAQGFGKNKVRSEARDWSVLTTEHFDVHFYDREKDAAVAAAEMAEDAYTRLAAVLHHEIPKRVPLILYASHSDFQETNALPGLIDVGTGGVTEFLRRRVVIPFTGSFNDFDHVLEHELVHAFQIDILFGGEGRDRLNPLTFRMPLWLMEGMAEHLSIGGDDAQTRMWISDACLSGDLPSLERMWWAADIRAYRYGQSAWRNITAARGDSICGDVLRAIVRHKDVEKGLETALGTTIEDLSDEWTDALRCEYLPLVAEREGAGRSGELLAGGHPRERLALAPAISPDGERFAYFSDKDLTMSLYVGDIATGKTRKLLEGETTGGLEELRTFHSSLAWSPDGRVLAFTAKGTEGEALLLVDAESGDVTRWAAPDLDEVRSPAFSPDGATIALVGIRGGESELYLYDRASSALERLTHDTHAERSPAFSPDGRWLAYTTDERDDGAGIGPDRLAVLDLDTRERELIPVLGHKAASPVWGADSGEIYFTSDPEGFSDIFAYRLADRSFLRLTHVLTGVQGILPTSACLSISADGEKLLFNALENASYGIYLATGLMERAVPFTPPAPAAPSIVASQEETLSANIPATEPSVAPSGDDSQPSRERPRGRPRQSETNREPESFLGDYDADIYDENTLYAHGEETGGRAPSFAMRSTPGMIDAPSAIDGSRDAGASETPLAADAGTTGALDEAGDTGLGTIDPATASETTDTAASAAIPESLRTITHEIRRYRPRFAPEFVVGGGTVGSGGGAFGASQIGFSDLLGDHRIRVGLGIYGSLSSADVAVAYENWTHKNGWGVSTFYHTNRYRRVADQVVIWEESELFVGTSFELIRPMSKFTRLEGSLTLGEMNELYRTRSYALSPIAGGDERHLFASVGLAYVNDTTIWGMTGPVKGRRLRLSAERTQGDLQVWTLRADVRRYWRPTHGFTVASRVIAGVRDGRLAENWHLGNTILVHGLEYGELTGSRMAVANLEARFPFIRMLALGFPLPITLRDIGGAAFVDAGTAWTRGFTNGGTDEYAARYGNLLGAYGVGMRANIGFGVLMVDVAQRTNFSRNLGEPRVYTTLGVEF